MYHMNIGVQLESNWLMHIYLNSMGGGPFQKDNIFWR